MVGKRGLEPPQRDEIVRVLGASPQLGLDLIADALDRFRIETRLDQGEAQELERPLALLAKRLELAAEGVALGVERQPDRPVLELGAERLAVELARPLVEQARDHVGEPLLAAGVERRAALEMQGERQERNRGLVDQVGFDPARADHALDLARAVGRGRRAERADHHEQTQRQRTSPHLSHCRPVLR